MELLRFRDPQAVWKLAARPASVRALMRFRGSRVVFKGHMDPMEEKEAARVLAAA